MFALSSVRFSKTSLLGSHRGASDINLVLTVVVLGALVSIVLSCNGWIKDKNMKRRGYVEDDASSTQSTSEGGSSFYQEGR